MKAPQHPLAWVAPQPFWREGGSSSPEQRTLMSRPQILRFAHDEFIEEMLATLAGNAPALSGYAARAETWRKPHAGPLLAPQARVEQPPSRLAPLLRRRQAKADPPALAAPSTFEALKLYQPAHLRHYLVTASLVCQTPGLPDRAIDPARQRVGFVMRRLVPRDPPAKKDPLPPPSDLSLWDEYAWVVLGKGGEWRRLGRASAEAEAAKLLAGEERLSMFPAPYTDAAGQARRLFAGSVPVGRREAYQAGQTKADAADVPPNTLSPRVVQLHVDVLGPWKAQIPKARKEDDTRPATIFALPPGSDFDAELQPTEQNLSLPALYRLRGELQIASWYLLSDLRSYLVTHARPYVEWLDQPAPQGPVPAPFAELHAALLKVKPSDAMRSGETASLSGSPDWPVERLATNLPDALHRIGPFVDPLELALTGAPDGAAMPFTVRLGTGELDTRAGWPDFLFLFADPWYGVPTPVPDAKAPGPRDYATEALAAQIDALAKIVDALPAQAAAVPEPTLASMQPTDMRPAWYVMRTVLERPECQPFEGPLVSRATQPFQLAGFFDPDAPARPIRIGLPVDISPAGLRKFDKNTVFMLSDMLCGQVDRFKGMTFGDLVLSVLPWPFHKGLSVPDKGPCKEGPELSLGVMCSLSIPIITICALILLMIIVALLDFLFRWLPFFVVCFPLPGFKGRKEGS